MRPLIGGAAATTVLLAVVAAPSVAGTGGAVEAGTLAVTAPDHDVQVLVEGDLLNSTGGLAFDAQGRLVICAALNNRVVRLDLDTGELAVLADESDGGLVTGMLASEPLLVPDDVAIGPDGDLFVTNILGKNVTRMAPDGTNRRIIGLPPLSDGVTGPNGIAFNEAGRLFVTDLTFSSATHPGGLWEVDPDGLIPPIPIVRGLPGPEGFAFGPDGLAYVPELFGGRIDVINVDTRSVHTLIDGFGNLTSLKFDADDQIIVLESDTGTVWRVDPLTGSRAFVAQGERGLDNLEISPDGTIYVSNFVSGNVGRVDEAAGTIQPVLPGGLISFPFSLDEAPDGSLLIGDLTSVASLDDAGTVTRHSSLLVDDVQLLTAGATFLGDEIYATDFFLPPGNVFKIDPATGSRELAATGFVFPWLIDEGRSGNLLVGDQALGTVFEVDPDVGVPVPVLTGLVSPSGMAWDDDARTIYVSNTGLGTVVAVRAIQVLGVEVFLPVPITVASGLDTPEGIAVQDDGQLLVVEAGTGTLLRIDPGTGDQQVVATGLPTDTVGIGLPLLNYSADVLARDDGSIVVTGSADGSVLELTPIDHG